MAAQGPRSASLRAPSSAAGAFQLTLVAMQPPSQEDLTADQEAAVQAEILAEVHRLRLHPNFEQLRRILVVDLPPDLHLFFQLTAAAYPHSGTLFDGVRAESGEEAARRMFNLLNGGVQEGARSAIYHLGRLQALEQEVRRECPSLLAEPDHATATRLAS